MQVSEKKTTLIKQEKSTGTKVYCDRTFCVQWNLSTISMFSRLSKTYFVNVISMPALEGSNIFNLLRLVKQSTNKNYIFF